jgi:hypothetical protein
VLRRADQTVIDRKHMKVHNRLRRSAWASPMRPNRQPVFRTDAAAKLDQLELIAALLERDATNNRAVIAELCSSYPRTARARAQRPRRWRKFALGANAAVTRVVTATVAIARSRRVRVAIRAVYAVAVDFTLVMSVACAAVAILTAAFLLTAPPV